MLLRDFFHSLAINLALFFVSLFAIDAVERTLVKMAVEGGNNGKGKRLVGKGWVKSMDTALSFL